MSNEQKLREALQEAATSLETISRLAGRGTYPNGDDTYMGTFMEVRGYATSRAGVARQALATTEPEPTGMPELPPLPRCMYQNMQHQRMYIGNVYTADQVKAYGEQCWKSGYKHGAWADKPEPTSKQSLQVEPAVNQQLTTEPVDERGAFEKWVTKNGEWPNNALRSRLDPDRYVDIQGLWEAWQARAAMAQVSDINAVESFTNDTKDAERYRWLRDDTDSDWAICEWSHDPGDEGYYRDARAPHIVDAAIDAAMAKGVKG